MTRTETITIDNDTYVTGYGVFEAGTYHVEMPEDYDPELVTAEDIVHDGSIRVVNPTPIFRLCYPGSNIGGDFDSHEAALEDFSEYNGIPADEVEEVDGVDHEGIDCVYLYASEEDAAADEDGAYAARIYEVAE